MGKVKKEWEGYMEYDPALNPNFSRKTPYVDIET